MPKATSLSRPVLADSNMISGFFLKSLLFLFAFLMFGLLVFYVFQINSLTKEIYLIQKYQKEISRINQENKSLEVEFSKVSSLANLESYLKDKNFEKTSQMRYIQIPDGEVVLKK